MAAIVTRRVADVARTADPADIDAWWDRNETEIVRAIRTGEESAATLAARYCRRHAQIEGVEVDPVRAAIDRARIQTSATVTGPVAFKKHVALGADEISAVRTMTSTLRGSAERLTLDGSRGTIMNTFVESSVIVGYRRITSGDPCAFCAMLASRGAIYSKSGVEFQAHDHCRCTAEPLYAHESEPESVIALRDQWDEVTAGLGGREALNAFRKARTGA